MTTPLDDDAADTASGPGAETGPEAEDRHEGRKAAVAATATVFVWASAFVVIRDVGHTMSPAPLALLRLAVAAAALSLLMLATSRQTRQGRRSRRMPRSRRTVGMIVTYGVLWLAGYTVALNAGEQHIDAGTAALLVNLAPLMIAIGAGFFLGEGFPRPLILGLVVALGGVAIIALDSSGGGDRVGVLYCLLAAVLFTAGMLIQKVALPQVDGLTATWLACVAGTLVLTPWIPQTVDELQAASTGAVLGAIYLGLFPTAVGFVTWAYALRRTSTGRLSATTYAVPAVSVLLSWLLLAETPTGYGLVGGGICLVGVALSRRQRPGPTAPLGAANARNTPDVSRRFVTVSAAPTPATAAPAPPGPRE